MALIGIHVPKPMRLKATCSASTTAVGAASVIILRRWRTPGSATTRAGRTRIASNLAANARAHQRPSAMYDRGSVRPLGARERFQTTRSSTRSRLLSIPDQRMLRAPGSAPSASAAAAAGARPSLGASVAKRMPPAAAMSPASSSPIARRGTTFPSAMANTGDTRKSHRG